MRYLQFRSWLEGFDEGEGTRDRADKLVDALKTAGEKGKAGSLAKTVLGKTDMLLEDAAAEAIKNPGEEDSYELALMFHRRIAEMIRIQCLRIWDDYGIRKVALTGGTFQNKILMEMTLELLRNEGFEVYYNVSVSPNDGGIALGQTYIASMKGND